MPHELAVWLFNERVGTLSLATGRLSFRYDADWLGQPNAMALSCSLPLQSAFFDDQQCRSFFAGLLPEGHLRKLIAQQCQVSGQNDFGLLAAIGGECAGAITFLPNTHRPTPPEDREVEWLSEQQLVAILDELPHRPMLAGQDGLRLSLAGAQDKLPVLFDGQRIGLPKNGQPSTHILKPPIQGVIDSVINEGFCMALAQAMKMTTSKTLIYAVGERRVLLVTRFDREHTLKGKTQRLHQEDFCQALSVVPEMKYQNEGGPDLRACFDLLRRVTRPSAPQVLQFLDYVVFNALIGNHDAHGKNFSLLYTRTISGGPVLAPVYDALSTAIYPKLTPKMAMKLGSKYKFSELHARHWDQFAEEAGLSKAQTRKRILGMASKLPEAAKQLQATKAFVAEPLIDEIVRLVEERSALTIRRLNDEASF